MYPSIVYLLVASILTITCSLAKDTFTELDQSSFSKIECVPYAYGDFNADKRVDIFCVSESGLQVEIWLAQEKEPLFSQFKKFTLKNNTTIFNIVPGDFNGDSVMDLLVVNKVSDGDDYQMSLFLGRKSSKYTNDLDPEKILPLTIKDQPMAGDFNGDGKIDLLVQTGGSKQDTSLFRFFKSEPSRTSEFLSFDINGDIEKTSELESNSLYAGYAHSIADMNNDYVSDLIVTTKNSDKNLLFQIFQINNNKYDYLLDNYTVPYKDKGFIYGQSLFADFDSDGVIEHLIPACKDPKCKSSVILIRKNFTWNELPIDFGAYGFIPPSESLEFWGENPLSLKVGDYNLNGYLDLMALVRPINSTNTENERYAVLMNNVHGEISTASPTFGRTFEIDYKIMFSQNNVVQASFFDLFDDGYLDILLVVKEQDPNDSSLTRYRLVALRNEYYDDVYFLKVMVIPGRCNVGKCPYQSLPYGLNYPGALVKIESTSFEYQRVILYACQLSQSSHMALQLPYIIFGLGSTANFVEHLSVAITSVTTNNFIKGYKKEWTQIVLNSQLVISPNPRDSTYSWKMQLFITPSKNILMTGISLGSTMICLIVIIGLLQYREKKMDEKERKLESQRFHFDGL